MPILRRAAALELEDMGRVVRNQGGEPVSSVKQPKPSKFNKGVLLTS
jgi:hypothetical protein